MRLLVLGLVVLAAHGSVHGSKDYPKTVLWERTDSAALVSEPNVLEGVDYVEPKAVSGPPTSKEEHIYFSQGVPSDKHECLRTNAQSGLKFMRPDLPGRFSCQGKTLYVIPEIKVERGRFFNVSLDFLKLPSSRKIPVYRFNLVPDGVSFDVSSSGIMFLSGIFSQGSTSTLLLSFKAEQKKTLYRIKVAFHVEEPVMDPNRHPIEFHMTPAKLDPTLTKNFEKQVRALECAAKAVSLRPGSFHGVNPASEFKNTSVLTAYSEQPLSCNLAGSCEDFSIETVVYNGRKECESATNKNAEDKPLTNQDTSGSEENAMKDEPEDVVVINKNNEFETSAPLPVPVSSTTARPPVIATTTSTSTTASTSTTTTEAPGPEKEQADVASPDTNSNANASEGPEVRSQEEPNVLHNEIPGKRIEEQNLKTAMYGMLGLAAIVVTIIFVFLFSRLELCKKKHGYDPVNMARVLDDGAKFA